MIPPFLAAIGVRGAIAIGCCLLVAGLMWRYDAVRDERDSLRGKVGEMGRRVLQADAAVAQAAVVNQAMRDALQAQNAAIVDARAAVAKLEADARKAGAALAARRAADQQVDRARRARADLPPAAEMTAVVREIVEAM